MLFVGVVLTVTALAIIALLPWFCGGIQSALGIWHEWQTLIAGLLALLASFIGFMAATATQRNASLRKAQSERAMLPFRLSSLCAIIERNGKSLQSASASAEQGQKAAISEWFTVPNELIEGVRENIEQSPVLVAEKLSQLLALVQVLQSRGLASVGAGALSSELTVYEMRTLAISLAEAHALVASLFSFARGENEDLIEPLTDLSIKNSLGQFGFWPDDDVVAEKLTLAMLVSSRYANGQLLTQKIGKFRGAVT